MDVNSKGGSVAVAPTPSAIPYPLREQEEQRIIPPVKEQPQPEPRVRINRAQRHIKMPNLAPLLQAYGGITFLLAGAALLWLADGYFTLWFLRGWVPSLATAGLLQWVIPVLITSGQLYFWPRKEKFATMWETRGLWLDDQDNPKLERRYERARSRLASHILLFTIITLFNVGTSAQGIYEWADGRAVNMFGGFHLPSAGDSLRVWSTIGGIITAFGAEKLFSWARAEMKEV